MHTTQQKLLLCQYCTFTSKIETEMKKHNEKYNITHSNLDYYANLEELNYEIFALKEIGLVIYAMQHFDSDLWKRWMETNFITLGKNPR